MVPEAEIVSPFESPPAPPQPSVSEPRLSRDEMDALGERIAKTAAHIDAATHRLLTEIRAFDDCGGWYEQGATSCAHWLSWRVGLALSAAREKVRVAHCLAVLPCIDEALRQGRLSYSKARAVTRVANPENQELLLEMSLQMTASQLEKTCRLWRQVQPKPQSATEEPLRRWVRYRETDDGMVILEARLHPEEAARVQKAIESSAKDLAGKAGASAAAMPDSETSAEDLSGQADASAASMPDDADGLVAIAEHVLGCRGAPGNRPVEVTMTIDAATMQGHTESGLGLSPAAARRLCCDAKIVPVTVDEQGTPLSVGRKTRVIPAAMRRALELRDKGCRFPGCSHRHVDAHHLEHWADGGETRLDNLLSTCRYHHRIIHEYGYAVETDKDGQLTFYDPEGRPVRNAVLRPALNDGWGELTAANHAAGVRSSAATNQPGWDGDPIDYDACIDALLP